MDKRKIGSSAGQLTMMIGDHQLAAHRLHLAYQGFPSGPHNINDLITHQWGESRGPSCRVTLSQFGK